MLSSLPSALRALPPIEHAGRYRDARLRGVPLRVRELKQSEMDVARRSSSHETADTSGRNEESPRSCRTPLYAWPLLILSVWPTAYLSVLTRLRFVQSIDIELSWLILSGLFCVSPADRSVSFRCWRPQPRDPSLTPCRTSHRSRWRRGELRPQPYCWCCLASISCHS